ncbi:TPA: nucleotidyl transferase AbiEii/AbiGii toxin family protein [Legionella pneumophila]|uniref:Uncharacterized protein n=2 Tax=Legionella pneumophila TaxID=446 RepID=A0A2S6EX88_LEGPN|nr:nucleotidyl transferase AbiEii/AbiGii toxin family protein [Legionella pneumophila]APF04011.1 hypothetical protein BIZ52_11825 [Legionella pneumophila subsp. fraseri]APF06994.1 hypothetical protein BIZ51_11715 [Legionella pneumophila subsp. fraseri]AUB69449.1 hypothetical protein BJK09_11625 [Legionella pneumophila]AUB72421.1 hypothetical protein BJK08_11620 [Legionella pneumophila]KXB27642.1 hypothetical protein PtVF89_05185 [Legionella pneumophila]
MTNSLKNKWNSFSEENIDLFKLINKISLINNCTYFLIGAKARDILLEYFGKNEAQRATLDTDIAICCKSWEEFYKIKNTLIEKSDFVVYQKSEHRLQSNKYGYLDIVPFGDIKDENSTLKWPPEYDIEFSLTGFDDAYQRSMDISISDLTIKVASPLGLALLKLFSWLSRKANKDASDLAYIISNYFDFDDQDRLNGKHHDLLEKDFDYTLSGCRLLGRDFKELSLETKIRLKELFDDPILMDNLAISITHSQLEYVHALSMLEMIKKGFND